MSKRPGDFTQKTIDILAKRTGQTCANPNCRKVTSSGHTEKNKAVIIGEAAHIYGEAPGSKRYDPVMTDEERKDISNAIWLCSVCHKKVDSDEMKYTPRILLKWKNDSENEERTYSKPNQSTNTPILDISLTGISGGPKGHFRVFTVKNISQNVAFDVICYIKGFCFFWKPEEFSHNPTILEPQKTKNVEYQMTISTSGLPPEKIPELYFYVEYKNDTGDRFQISRELIQNPVPTNIYNDFTVGNFTPPTRLEQDDFDIKFVRLLDNTGGGRKGLFEFNNGKRETVIFGISSTLLATWELNDTLKTEEAIKEIGNLQIKEMINKGDVKEVMLTTHDVPNELQSGFENYTKFRNSLRV